MKVTIILSLAALICLPLVAEAQTKTELNQVTLYGSISHGHDGTRSGVDFDGDGSASVENRTSIRINDLNYGTLIINSDVDWLEARDPRSMIIDLGKKKWADIKETPPFPKRERRGRPTLEPPKAVDASVGARTISPYRQFVKTKVGHIYLMRALKPGKTFYVMFRVESLKSNDSCTISWKKVAPPLEAKEK